MSISNQLWTAVEFSHLVLKKYIKEGDIVIDATLGNGHDALFIAGLVGEQGMVVGFDIQESAIHASQLLFKTEDVKAKYKFICANHSSILSELNGMSIQRIQCAIFNLGYLPWGDKSIITQPGTTIKALESVMSILEIGGCITVVVYSGHQGAKEEKQSVIDVVSSLDKKKWQTMIYSSLNRETSPDCIAIVRIA
jgi:predicted methyltransferase